MAANLLLILFFSSLIVSSNASSATVISPEQIRADPLSSPVIDGAGRRSWHGRVELEVNDYSESGSNGRHTPPNPNNGGA
ncbi:unnamed protein product [Linum trigynum]|uniref:Uncharacterized protein n=1 Tax=Linum trigynum TaxID=586398 RepID=A0AAV2EWE1_9ROSI